MGASPSGTSLLDPETLTRIGNLELVARRVVQGFFSGLHRSSMRGFSTEFDQFRPYAQGDDLKHVDWRIFARTDRFFVKEFEADRNLDTWLMLDASGSMGFQGAGAGKFRYAAMLAASLAYLLLRQHDRVGLWLMGGNVPGMLPVGCRPGQLQRFIALLESITPAGSADPGGELRTLMGRQGRPGLVVVISDLYETSDTLRSGLALLRQAGHELLVFHLLDSQELDFPFRGPVEFVDLETGESRAVDASQARDGYRRRLARFLEDASDLCSGVGAGYLQLDTAASLAAPLAAFLAARSGWRRPAIPWR
jgi:uncharacterized protein (DUF58 family)